MMGSLVWALWSTAVVAQVPSSDSGTWMLRWNAPEGCIQAAELAERIERRAGRPLFAAVGRRMLDGNARTSGAQRYGARLTLLDSTGRILGTRDLEVAGSSCRVLDERLEFIAAMLINAQEVSPPPPAPIEEAIPTPPPPPPAELYPPRGPSLIKLKPTVPNPPTRLAVTPEHWFANERAITLDGFYSILGRNDLRTERSRRAGLRTFGLVMASLAAATGVGLLVAHVAQVGCTRYAGSSLAPGPCVEQPPDFLIAGISALAVSAAVYLWAGLFQVAPTSYQEERQLADAFNAKHQATP